MCEIEIKAIKPSIILPKRATPDAAAYDVFMPVNGTLYYNRPTLINLGFATAIPKGYCALLFVRSSAGTQKGIYLSNTIGLIDSDYRGEWKASLQLRATDSSRDIYMFEEGQRLLQFMVVPVIDSSLKPVKDLGETQRGEGGFGSTGH